MLFRREIGPHAHVHHCDFPLCRTVAAWRSDVVTTHAVLGPELSAASFRS